jgi:hypothetical protein
VRQSKKKEALNAMMTLEVKDKKKKRKRRTGGSNRRQRPLRRVGFL